MYQKIPMSAFCTYDVLVCTKGNTRVANSVPLLRDPPYHTLTLLPGESGCEPQFYINKQTGSLINIIMVKRYESYSPLPQQQNMLFCLLLMQETLCCCRIIRIDFCLCWKADICQLELSSSIAIEMFIAITAIYIYLCFISVYITVNLFYLAFR